MTFIETQVLGQRKIIYKCNFYVKKSLKISASNVLCWAHFIAKTTVVTTFLEEHG